MSSRKRKAAPPQRLSEAKRARIEAEAAPTAPGRLVVDDNELMQVDDSDDSDVAAPPPRPRPGLPRAPPTALAVDLVDPGDARPEVYLWGFRLQSAHPDFAAPLQLTVVGPQRMTCAVAGSSAAVPVTANVAPEELELLVQLAAEGQLAAVAHAAPDPEGTLEVLVCAGPNMLTATPETPRSQARVTRLLGWLGQRYPQVAVAQYPRTSDTDEQLVQACFAHMAQRGLAFEPLPRTELPPELLTTLRPYQWRAVSWMLDRERRGEVTTGLVVAWLPLVSLVDHRPFYLHHPSGCVTATPPTMPQEWDHVHGGILADEMGLGKTVELLTCAILNRAPPSVEPPAVDMQVDDREEPAGDLEDELPAVKECFCGGTVKGHWLRCVRCDRHQHYECAGYDKPPALFECAHCLTSGSKLRRAGTTLIIAPG